MSKKNDGLDDAAGCLIGALIVGVIGAHIYLAAAIYEGIDSHMKGTIEERMRSQNTHAFKGNRVEIVHCSCDVITERIPGYIHECSCGESLYGPDETEPKLAPEIEPVSTGLNPGLYVLYVLIFVGLVAGIIAIANY